MKTGRNDPCPCGSGKKYKKCCLLEARPAAEPEADRADLRAAALEAVSRFGLRPEHLSARDAALALFRGEHVEDRDDTEAIADEKVKFAFYYFFDHVLDDGRSLAESFLLQSAYQLDSRQQRLLRRLCAARLRPYEVEEVRMDEGLELRDLWSKQKLFVTERSGTHQLTRWDLLVARVVPEEDGTSRLESGVYVFPTRLKQPLLGALRRAERHLRRHDPGLDEDRFFKGCATLVHQLWLDKVVFAPMPTIVTAEGDPMVFGKVVFDVADRAAARAALDEHPVLRPNDDGGYVWFEETDDFSRSLGHIVFQDDCLVLEVTSRQRAERGRRLLRMAAGTALRHRATRYESLQKAIERHRSDPPREEPDPVPPEVAAELIRDFKERHYRAWPDEPLPGLDGHTPRHAARLKTLKLRLTDMLKEMENYELRAIRPETPPYDLGWIWTELGLERPT